MADREQSEGTVGALRWSDNLHPAGRGAIRPESTERRDRPLGPAPGARNAQSFDKSDSIHQAAQELVRALDANRWSLHAAAIVVALHRLSEAVQAADVTA